MITQDMLDNLIFLAVFMNVSQYERFYQYIPVCQVYNVI